MSCSFKRFHFIFLPLKAMVFTGCSGERERRGGDNDLYTGWLYTTGIALASCKPERDNKKFCLVINYPFKVLNALDR